MPLLCNTSRLDYLEELSSTKINFQNSYATLYLNTDKSIGHLEWMGIVPSDYYRSTLLQALEVIHQHKVLFWIQDMRKLRKLSPIDTDWMIHEFMPLLLASPLKKIALLESEEYIDSLFLRDMVYASYTHVPFQFRYVDSVAYALSWFTKTYDQPLQLTSCFSTATSSASFL